MITVSFCDISKLYITYVLRLFSLLHSNIISTCRQLNQVYSFVNLPTQKAINHEEVQIFSKLEDYADIGLQKQTVEALQYPHSIIIISCIYIPYCIISSASSLLICTLIVCSSSTVTTASALTLKMGNRGSRTRGSNTFNYL